MVLLVLSLLISVSTNCFSQDTTQASKKVASDSSLSKKKHKASMSRPGKAALLSAVVPGLGLGQIYNKKYWKAPVVWGLMGSTIYGALWYNNQYNESVDLYEANSTSPLAPQYLSNVNYYRKYRDMLIIGASLVYVMSIVDAYVDAHLMEFDIKDDLSVRISPDIIYTNHTGIIPGLSVNFSFKSKYENRSSWLR